MSWWYNRASNPIDAVNRSTNLISGLAEAPAPEFSRGTRVACRSSRLRRLRRRAIIAICRCSASGRAERETLVAAAPIDQTRPTRFVIPDLCNAPALSIVVLVGELLVLVLLFADGPLDVGRARAEVAVRAVGGADERRRAVRHAALARADGSRARRAARVRDDHAADACGQSRRRPGRRRHDELSPGRRSTGWRSRSSWGSPASSPGWCCATSMFSSSCASRSSRNCSRAFRRCSRAFGRTSSSTA